MRPVTLSQYLLEQEHAGFTLDRELGTFVPTAERITVPEDTAEFAIDMSNMRNRGMPVYCGTLPEAMRRNP